MRPIVRAAARLLAPALLAGMFLLPMRAVAHHGWGSFDADKPMTVESVIEEATIGNPHGSMVVMYDGRRWEVILAPPSRMNARGATARLIAKGRPVKVHGYPRRDGAAEMLAEWIEIDGKRFDLR